MRSERREVVDLTKDSDNDDDEGPLALLPATIAPAEAAFGSSSTNTSMRGTSTRSIVRPDMLSTPRYPSLPNCGAQIDQLKPNRINQPPTSIQSVSPSTTNHFCSQSFNTDPVSYVLVSSNGQQGKGMGESTERAAKRMRVSGYKETMPFSLLQDVPHQTIAAGLMQGQQTSTTSSGWNSTMKDTDSSAWRHYSEPKEPLHDGNKESVLSNVSSISPSNLLPRPSKSAVDPQAAHAQISTALPKTSEKPSKSVSGTTKSINPFTVAQDHYLIFLKEVKQYQWKQITEKFNAEFPNRSYPNLQFRYSSHLNKRDRAQDPTTLILPAKCASESAIDWQTVHANHPGYRARSPSRLRPEQPVSEHIYDSGTDPTLRRDRSRRAKRVDYTWSKISRKGSEDDEVLFENTEDMNISSRSSSPVESAPVPDTAVAVDNEPMIVDHVAHDAEIALSRRNGPKLSTDRLPYLSRLQRSIAQAPTNCDWNQLGSRNWQNSLLHVDFSPVEIDVVQTALANLQRFAPRSRHSTPRRQLRNLLQNSTPPMVLQLVSSIRQRLPGRDRDSIAAFLQDAKAGHIADVPRITRLAAARPQSSQRQSTSHMIRQREMGCCSKRGWRTASKPITYEVKNKVLDTTGPAFCWTGASSDVHVVAWAPDGESFAAGAVAVDDPDSMQYNRSNNLLYGHLPNKTIHELGEHTKDRIRTESGANSTHAMFVSQDPKLYSTVSSVAFSTSGTIMYSAGYDGTVCVWHTETESTQPVLGSKLNARAMIDIMTVNRCHAGVLATAAKITESKAVRLLTIDEEEPSNFSKHSFHSSKAVSRSDLKILPTALQFEPAYGGLLLAGFGAKCAR